MLLDVSLIWSKCKNVPETGFSPDEVALLNVDNTEVVVRLYVVWLEFEDLTEACFCHNEVLEVVDADVTEKNKAFCVVRVDLEFDIRRKINIRQQIVSLIVSSLIINSQCFTEGVSIKYVHLRKMGKESIQWFLDDLRKHKYTRGEVAGHNFTTKKL